MTNDLSNPELARWRDLATAALKGRAPEQLIGDLVDGVPMQPLYVDRPPGSEPRGRVGVWECRVALPDPLGSVGPSGHGSARDTLAQAFAQIAERGCTPWVSPSVADGVSGAAVVLDAGADVRAAAARAGSLATVYVDPIAELAVRGGLPLPWATALDDLAAGRLGRLPSAGARSGALGPPPILLAPSGVWAAQGGAQPPTALAIALSALVDLLRALESRGVPPATAATDLELRVALRGDVLADLALVRAARRLAERLLLALGVGPVGARVCAVYPETELSSVDPATNLLRMAAAGFGAAAGGADSLVLPAHDAATGAPTLNGVKLAANLHLLLAAEAMVGRVEDPTAGSYAVEHLTDALARAAWAELQRVEGEGGLVASLRAGTVQARIAAAAQARASRIATREEPRIGVSVFVDASAELPPPAALLEPAEPTFERVAPCPPLRPDAAWEALRRRLALAQVPAALVAIGPRRQHQARLDFARDLLLAAGFIPVEIQASDPAATAAAVGGSGAAVVCLCGSDEGYIDAVPSLAPALASAGVRAIVVAGRWPQEAESWRAVGVSHVVHLGADVLAIGSALADLAIREPR